MAAIAAIVMLCGLFVTPGIAQDAYRLGAGDTVEVMVIPGLDTPVTLKIDNEGRIIMPLVGIVEIGGQTTAEAGDTVSKVLTERQVFADPIVAVSLSIPRPIFVTGDVTEPGSYPGRLGMRVDEAIAIAGGTRNKASTELSAGAIAELQSELVGIVAEIESLDIRKARYEAEAEERDFTTDQIAAEAGQSAFVLRMAELEARDHEIQTQKFLSKINALEKQLDVLEEEREAITGQQEALTRIVELFDEEVTTANELEERGLGLRRQSLSNERSLFSARAELMDQRRRYASTQQEEIQIRQDIDELHADRRQVAYEQLSKVELERVGLLAERDAITSRLGYSSVYTGTAGDQGPMAAEGSVEIGVTRIRELPNGERVTESVDSNESVLPGDLLVVRILPNFKLLQ